MSSWVFKNKTQTAMTNMMKQHMLQKLSVKDLTLCIQLMLRGNDTLGVTIAWQKIPQIIKGRL